jgi:hypothetical protein
MLFPERIISLKQVSELTGFFLRKSSLLQSFRDLQHGCENSGKVAQAMVYLSSFGLKCSNKVKRIIKSKSKRRKSYATWHDWSWAYGSQSGSALN